MPAWLNLPRPEYLLPVLVGVGAALLLLLSAEGSWPGALAVCVFLSVYAVARGRIGMALTGLAIAWPRVLRRVSAACLDTLAERVGIWQSPWDNAVAGGDQVAQAIWASRDGRLTAAPASVSATRGTCLPDTPISCWRPSARSSGSSGCRGYRRLCALIAVSRLPHRRRAANDYGFFLATVLTLFLSCRCC